MKGSDIHVGSVTIMQLQRDILQDTNEQYTKGSDILAGIAAIRQLQRLILLDMKEEYMKE